MKPVFALEENVRKRYSVRSYKGGELSAELQEKLSAYAAEQTNPLGPGPRVQFIHKASAPEGEKLGTYGIIRGARSFMAVTMPRSDYAQEALGYQFEELVLYATSLGLGTCWLGGTFNRSAFAKSIEIGEDEIFAIVSPVGEAARVRVGEAVFRRSLGADKRLDWDKLFFDSEFGSALTQEAAGDYAYPLEMLRLAPSAVNKQPWRVLRRGGAYHFFELHSLGGGESGAVDMQRVDLGIAICHFHLACVERGLGGHFERLELSGPEVPENTDYICSWITE